MTSNLVTPGETKDPDGHSSKLHQLTSTGVGSIELDGKHRTTSVTSVTSDDLQESTPSLLLSCDPADTQSGLPELRDLRSLCADLEELDLICEDISFGKSDFHCIIACQIDRVFTNPLPSWLNTTGPPIIYS